MRCDSIGIWPVELSVRFGKEMRSWRDRARCRLERRSGYDRESKWLRVRYRFPDRGIYERTH